MDDKQTARDFFRAMLPSDEEVAAMVARGEARRRARIEAGAALNGFTPVDLGCWMALCEKAGVPTVPALEIGSAPTIALWESSDNDGPVDDEIHKLFTNIAETQIAMPVGWMMRWSCCSMADVKVRLSEGQPEWHPNFMQLFVEDFRAFDLIAEFPLPRISAWARPWLTFDVVDGYPVEYRVFVRDNKVIGISNYYPQRPLPDDDKTAVDVSIVRRMTEALIDAQNLPLNAPEVAGDLDLSKNQFSADFARLPSGAILFLEGGPPHTHYWGAHPCCFDGGEIAGIALSKRGE